MNAFASLTGSEKTDPHAVKQWAAEDFAISVGWLRECPYHGQPYRVRAPGQTSHALALGLIHPNDPIAKIFNGNTRELVAAAHRVARNYGERCEMCAASDHEDFD
jgi:hypothetical protein